MAGKRAYFRFYEELNDFLPEEHRYRTIERPFELAASVKDMIEALGVPHTEIDLIVVDGRSVDFSYLVADGDRVGVYPMFESLDISDTQRLRATPLRHTRVIVDANLGALARYLRLLGFDTAYSSETADAELARISVDEKRLLLTRDVGVLKRAAVTHGYFVRSQDPREQVIEVLARFDLADAVDPLSRCARCNGVLVDVAKGDIVERLPPSVRESHDDFCNCPDSGQLYWRGSHLARIDSFVDDVVAAAKQRGLGSTV
ncbi:MAG: Mut7-C RNAse domain-containing protein [Actinomycetota bacterium]